MMPNTDQVISFQLMTLVTRIFHFSSGPAPHSEMVSRRRILSRSRDDLNLDSAFVMQEEEEDVWYQRDKLYKVRGTSSLTTRWEIQAVSRNLADNAFISKSNIGTKTQDIPLCACSNMIDIQPVFILLPNPTYHSNSYTYFER